MNISAQVFFSRVKAALPEDQGQLSTIILVHTPISELGKDYILF